VSLPTSSFSAGIEEDYRLDTQIAGFLYFINHRIGRKSVDTGHGGYFNLNLFTLLDKYRIYQILQVKVVFPYQIP